MTGSAPRSRIGWRRVRMVLRWSATAGILGWLAVSTNWPAIGGALAKASVRWLLVAAACYLASQFASVARWQLLVRAAGIVTTRMKLLAAYFEGMFVNVCVPTTVGGDVLKILRIGGGSQKQAAASSIFADRMSGLIALFILFLAGVLTKLNGPAIAAALLVVAVAAPLLALSWLLREKAVWIARSPLVARVASSSAFANVSKWIPAAIPQVVARSPWIRVFSYALVVQSLNIAAVGAAGRAIGLAIPIVDIVIATTTVSVAAALPISIAGLGVREASLPILLASQGVPRELAVGLGILWSSIVLSIGLLGGPLHFVRQYRFSRKDKSAAQTEVVTQYRAA